MAYRVNPFQKLYDACNNGDPEEKYKNLSSGPSIVDIEPVGLCNFKCVFCPTGLGALGRPSGFMDLETYKAILLRTEPFQSAIRYIGFGEPLMHPDIVTMVSMANFSGRYTHINTNGSKLTKEMAEGLVDAGLTSMKFSFQGTDAETYHSMRATDFFDGMLNAIVRIKDARGGEDFPVISASTTITDETPEMVHKFKEIINPLVDDLTIGRTIFEYIDMSKVPPRQKSRLEEAAKKTTSKKNHPVPCPETFEKLTIHWDGAVRVCCNDFSGITNLGNINENYMNEIWNHQTMQMYRERLSEKDYSLPLCKDCFDYMECTGAAD